MKSNRIYISFALLLVAISFFVNACTKKDTTPPTLSLTSPADASTFHLNDSIRIIGTTTDESLHELEIKITNDSTAAIMYLDTPEVHDLTSYNINSTWKVNVAPTVNATLTVTVQDHSEHTTIQTKKLFIR